jgi:hypothetical protein
VEYSLRIGKRVIMGVASVLVLTAVAAVIFGTVSSVVQTSKTISNVGSVKGIGVGIYWDAACTNRTSSINWGLLDPGSNKTATVYVRNEGNTVATLSKATQNWNPSTASSYMTLNWNYAGQTLSVNQVLQTRLTLVVSSSITGITSFAFDIVIIATG